MRVRFFTVLFLIVQLPYLYPEDPIRKRVLVLHSYKQGYQWTDEIQQGIASSFMMKPELDLVIEYLNANVYSGDDYDRLILALFTHKYQRVDQKFDLIIVSDDHAFDFMLEYRKELFPGVPLVFCGVNDFSIMRLRGQRDITGINEAQSMRETLEIGLQLFPATRRIVVLAGERLSERINSNTFKAIATEWADQYEIEYLEGITKDQVAERLRSYQKETLVLYLSYMLDAAGTILDWKEGIKLATTNMDLPVFVMSDFQVRNGVLGGKVVDGYAQGEAAARLGLRILAGEESDSIPVVMESPNVFLFDDRELERFGIDPSRISVPYERTNLRTGDFIRDWHENGTRSFFAYELFELHGTNMLLIDAASGIIVDANQAARRFYGYPRLVGMNIGDINELSDEEVRTEMAKARDRNTNVFTFRHRLADGTVHEISNYSWPVRVHNTDLLFSVIFDITPQKKAEALAKEREVQFRVVLVSALFISLFFVWYLIKLLNARRHSQIQVREALRFKTTLLNAIPNPVFFKDVQGRYQEWNKAFEELTGRSTEELAGKTILDIADEEAVQVHIEHEHLLYRDSQQITSYEVHQRMSNGKVVDILVHKAIVTGEDGSAVGLVGVFTNLEEAKKREAELRASLSANRTLIKELFHRTKNNMQVIDSLLTLKQHEQKNPAIREVLQDIGQRIRTMALVHQQLYDSGNLSQIALQQYLKSLIESTFQGYLQEGKRIAYQLDCPDILLLIDYALPCAMAINELLTNSCKHAFPDRDEGLITIRVFREVPDVLVLEYRDDGVGLTLEAAQDKEGNPLGLTMLRMLVEHQLNGSIYFGPPPGMSCVIRFRENMYTERVVGCIQDPAGHDHGQHLEDDKGNT